MSLYDEYGNIDIERVARKHLCHVKLAGSIRGLNAYELKHGTVYVSSGVINNEKYDKPILCVCVPFAVCFSLSPYFAKLHKNRLPLKL